MIKTEKVPAHMGLTDSVKDRSLFFLKRRENINKVLQRVIRSVKKKTKQSNGKESHGAEVCTSGSYSGRRHGKTSWRGCSLS